MDCLHRIRAQNEKVLIFTRHLDMQQVLAAVVGAAFGRWPDIVNGAAGGSRRRADTYGLAREARAQRLRSRHSA